MTLKSTTGRIVFIEGGERLVYREGLGLEFVIDYDLKKKKFQSSVWRVRDQLRPEKKDTGGKFSLRPEKKSSSRLSGGYAINYDRKKKRYRREFFIMTGKKKFQSSVWRVCQFLALTLTLIVFSVSYVLSNLY